MGGDSTSDKARSVTFSADPKLIGMFKAEAKKAYGLRGASRAGSEAMTEWLAKRGVNYVDKDAVTAGVARLKKLDALAALEVDVDELLDRALEEAGQPLFSTTGT